jgi:hypothetical protein
MRNAGCATRDPGEIREDSVADLTGRAPGDPPIDDVHPDSRVPRRASRVAHPARDLPVTFALPLRLDGSTGDG